MEQQAKKKVNIRAIVGAAVGGLVMILVQQYFFKTPSFDQAMMLAASEVNKSCPMMVDKETRLDNAVALPENIFQYNYTLINMEKATTAVSQIEEFLKPNLINQVRTNPALKIYRDNKTTLAYYYNDKNGEFLLKVLVTPDLYQE